MKVKTLICNCKGLDPFRYADMNSLAFEIESEFDVSYAVVHPQLCAESGNQILQDVLRAAEDDPDTYVMVCACAGRNADEALQEGFAQHGVRRRTFCALGRTQYDQRRHPGPNPRAAEGACRSQQAAPLRACWGITGPVIHVMHEG